MKAWTFDELYGAGGQFLDGLDERGQAFVGEVPPNFHVWLSKPIVRRKPPKHQGKTGRRAKYPCLARRQPPPSEVQNLARYSPGFYEQQAQKYRTKDTCHGPEVWEIRWHTCWRKTHTSGLVSRQGTLIVARNVLSDHDAGLYAGGLILTKAVLFLPQFVVVLAFPAMSSASERRQALTRSLALVGVLGVVATAGAWLLSGLALVFVGGQEYAEIQSRLWLFAVLGTVLAMLQLLVYSVLAQAVGEGASEFRADCRGLFFQGGQLVFFNLRDAVFRLRQIRPPAVSLLVLPAGSQVVSQSLLPGA